MPLDKKAYFDKTVEFLVLLCGSFVLPFIFSDVQNLSLSGFCIGAVAFISLFLYGVKQKYRLLYWLVLSVTLLFFIAVIYSDTDIIKHQYLYVKNALEGKEGYTESTELFFLLLGGFSAVAVSFFSSFKKGGVILFLLFSFVFTLSPFYDVRISVMTAVVFLTYIFGAFMENRAKFAFAFVFCALIFALSSLTVLYNIKPASKFAKNVDKKTGQLIRDITGRDPFHGDISDGDSVILDKKYMDIYVDKLPEEVLYLKNFSSGDYSNGRWLEDTDDAIYKSIAYEEGWQKYEDMLEPMVESEFFTLNDTLENKKRTNAIKLKEEKSGILDEQVCRPYYGKKEYKWKNKLISSEARVFKLFQMKDIDFTWEEASEKEWTARVFEKYVPKAKEVYTEYPSDGLERLSALKSPYSGAKEVTAYIVHILNDNAIYTLEPGKADGNYDINEYFLFENHRGYCEQYASAATLIYRVNGIPARYVTGYHIMPNTFLDAPDGTYMTTLTDRHAHSWVEILTEEYGWVPVDVTPDASGVIHATFPGFSEENLSNLMEERGWKRIRTAAAGTFEGTDDEEEEEEAEEESLQYEGENRLIYLLPFGAVLLFSVALKYLLFPLKKRKALKLCQGMRDMLIFSGLSPKCDVSDERFKNAIYQTEGGENIYPCILKAYYSEEGCNEKENLILFYKALKKELKKKSGIFKKIFIEILY